MLLDSGGRLVQPPAPRRVVHDHGGGHGSCHCLCHKCLCGVGGQLCHGGVLGDTAIFHAHRGAILTAAQQGAQHGLCALGLARGHLGSPCCGRFCGTVAGVAVHVFHLGWHHGSMPGRDPLCHAGDEGQLQWYLPPAHALGGAHRCDPSPGENRLAAGRLCLWQLPGCVVVPGFSPVERLRGRQRRGGLAWPVRPGWRSGGKRPGQARASVGRAGAEHSGGAVASSGLGAGLCCRSQHCCTCRGCDCARRGLAVPAAQQPERLSAPLARGW